MTRKTLIDVAVELPIDRTFTYNLPSNLQGQVCTGKRVLVPFGKRVLTGFCIGFNEERGITDVKDILDVLDDEPLFDEKRLRFFRWMASYYFAPLGEVLSLTCSAGANIKSQRYFFASGCSKEEPGSLTDRGEGTASTLSKDILDVIRKRDGISLATLIKIFKGKSVYSDVNKLRHAGLIREELRIKGSAGEKTETFVSVVDCLKEAVCSDLMLKRAPIQAKTLAYLSEYGETPLRVLRNKFGSIEPAVRKLEEKGFIRLDQKKIRRDPLEDTVPEPVLHELTDEQAKAVGAISESLKQGAFAPFILYGVTGSGKTLVYLRALEQAIGLGRQAILLVPEISLIPWPARYLSALFPGRVAVFHSGLTEGERYDEWKRIKNGMVDVVVGARSALFTPLKKLGLIIVDEEHEPSYKQEEGVRYNARDLSLVMGKMFNLTVILGSATPSIETFYNAQIGKIKPLYLSKRILGRPMPIIEITDMRKNSGVKGNAGERQKGNSIISERLYHLMSKNYEYGSQTILFLNRRGFSNFLLCRGCGYVFNCLNCCVSLTMHKGSGTLRCHYCDMSIPIPDVCPKCNGKGVEQVGVGTEQLEAEVRRMFPQARVGRMDRDTTRGKRAHQKILDAVDRGDVNVLVGTQMVAKGHHFPNVILVGIISADTPLNLPDFRSSERTFQLITQASGRSGRGDTPGRVVIQTFNPDHFCLRWAAEQDYNKFFEEELNNRRELSYPPFSRIANVRFEGVRVYDVEAAARKLKGIADSMLKGASGKGITVLGPAPAFLSKLRGRYRWQMLIKGKDTKLLHEFIGNMLRGFKEGSQKGVRLLIDVDPVSTI